MPYRPSLIGANTLKSAPQLGYFSRSSIRIAFSILSQNPLGDLLDGSKLNQSRQLDETLLIGWKRNGFGAVERIFNLPGTTYQASGITFELTVIREQSQESQE
jgi:hypothetical protein